MKNNLAKPWRSLLVFSLVATIILSQPSAALARRGGGRIGGSSFRAPTRSMPRTSSPRYGGGGNFFFLPFFFGGGGGSLLGILAIMAIAGVVLQAVRNTGSENFFSGGGKVTVSKLQIGLLASARQIQHDLNRLAQSADTSSGLALLLQEATISLLRHPEYWVYADSSVQTTKPEDAEAKFNALAMGERQKLTVEVVSNFNNRRQNQLPLASSSKLEAPSEYIVVTIVTAAAGSTQLPPVRSAQDLNQALRAIGSTGEQQLLGVEILWEPQSEAYTLTADELLTVYPSLLRI